jgi:hypothetical protein
MLRTPLLLAPLALLVVAGGVGCAFGEFRLSDPFDRQYSLEERQKIYSDLVRWSKFEEAAKFVDPETRRSFLAAMPDFAEVRFTDWEAAPWELDDKHRTATIEVTYKGYSMSSPIEVAVIERQAWVREGTGNNWSVRSGFTGLERLAGN